MGDKEEVKKGKHDLQNDLREKGIYADGVKEDLVTRCIANGIPVKKTQQKVLKEGWFGKSKGVLQILWE